MQINIKMKSMLIGNTGLNLQKMEELKLEQIKKAQKNGKFLNTGNQSDCKSKDKSKASKIVSSKKIKKKGLLKAKGPQKEGLSEDLNPKKTKSKARISHHPKFNFFSISQILFGSLSSKNNSQEIINSRILNRNKKRADLSYRPPSLDMRIKKSPLEEKPEIKESYSYNEEKESEITPLVLNEIILNPIPPNFFIENLKSIKNLQFKNLFKALIFTVFLKLLGITIFIFLTSDWIPFLNKISNFKEKNSEVVQDDNSSNNNNNNINQQKNLNLYSLIVAILLITFYQFTSLFLKQTQKSMLKLAAIEFYEKYYILSINKIGNMDLQFLRVMDREKLTRKYLFLVSEMSKKNILLAEFVESILDQAILLTYLLLNTHLLLFMVPFVGVSLTITSLQFLISRKKGSSYSKTKEIHRLIYLLANNPNKILISNMKNSILNEYSNLTRTLKMNKSSFKNKIRKFLKKINKIFGFGFLYFLVYLGPLDSSSKISLVFYILLLKTHLSSFNISRIISNHVNCSKFQNFIKIIPEAPKSNYRREECPEIEEEQKINLYKSRNLYIKQGEEPAPIKSDNYLDSLSNEETFTILKLNNTHLCQYSDLYASIFLKKIFTQNYRSKQRFKEALSLEELERDTLKKEEFMLEDLKSRGLESSKKASSRFNSKEIRDIVPNQEIFSSQLNHNFDFCDTTRRANLPSINLATPKSMYSPSTKIMRFSSPHHQKFLKMYSNDKEIPQKQESGGRGAFSDSRSIISRNNLKKGSKTEKSDSQLAPQTLPRNKKFISYKGNFLEDMKNGEKKVQTMSLKKYAQKQIRQIQLSENPRIRVTNKNIVFNVNSAEKICLVTEGGDSSLQEFLEGLFGESFGPNFDPLNTTPSQNISYCDLNQDTFLHNRSVRDNILMGETYYKFKYESIMELLGLQYLFEDRRDTGMVGEEGGNLRVQERYLVKLARFLYKERELYILANIDLQDSKFKSIDLFKKVLHSQLSTCATIYCSNDTRMIEQSDKIVFFNKGEITWTGTYEYLKEKTVDFKKMGFKASRKEHSTFEVIEKMKLRIESPNLRSGLTKTIKDGELAAARGQKVSDAKIKNIIQKNKWKIASHDFSQNASVREILDSLDGSIQEVRGRPGQSQNGKKLKKSQYNIPIGEKTGDLPDSENCSLEDVNRNENTQREDGDPRKDKKQFYYQVGGCSLKIENLKKIKNLLTQKLKPCIQESLKEFNCIDIIFNSQKSKILQNYIFIISTSGLILVLSFGVEYYFFKMNNSKLGTLINYLIYYLTFEIFIPFLMVKSGGFNKQENQDKGINHLTNEEEDYWMIYGKRQGRPLLNIIYIQAKDWLYKSSGHKENLLIALLSKMSLIAILTIHVLVWDLEYFLIGFIGFILGFLYFHITLTNSIDPNPFNSFQIQKIKFESCQENTTGSLLELRTSNHHSYSQYLQLNLQDFQAHNVDCTLSKNWVKARLCFLSEFSILLCFVGSILSHFLNNELDQTSILGACMHLVLFKILIHDLIKSYIELIFHLIDIFYLNQLKNIYREDFKQSGIKIQRNPENFTDFSSKKETKLDAASRDSGIENAASPDSSQSQYDNKGKSKGMEVGMGTVIQRKGVPLTRKESDYDSYDSMSVSLFKTEKNEKGRAGTHFSRFALGCFESGPQIPKTENNFLSKKIILEIEDEDEEEEKRPYKNDMMMQIQNDNTNTKNMKRSKFPKMLISLRDFSLEINGKKSLNNFNLHVHEGETVALLELRESGLTSLKKLLTGELFYKNNQVELKTSNFRGKNQRQAGIPLSDSWVGGFNLAMGKIPGVGIMDSIGLIQHQESKESILFLEGNILKNLKIRQKITNKELEQVIDKIRSFEIAQIIIHSFEKEFGQSPNSESSTCKTRNNLFLEYSDYQEYSQLYELSIDYIYLAYRNNLLVQRLRNLDFEEELSPESKGESKNGSKIIGGGDPKKLRNTSSIHRNFFEALIEHYFLTISPCKSREGEVATAISTDDTQNRARGAQLREVNEELSSPSSNISLEGQAGKLPFTGALQNKNGGRRGQEVTSGTLQTFPYGSRIEVYSLAITARKTSPCQQKGSSIENENYLISFTQIDRQKIHQKNIQNKASSSLQDTFELKGNKVFKIDEKIEDIKDVKNQISKFSIELESLNLRIISAFLSKRVNAQGSNLFPNLVGLVQILRAHFKETASLYILDQKSLNTHPGGLASNLGGLEKPGRGILCFVDDFREIMEFDRLLIVSSGRVIEDGDPFDLIGNCFSILNSIVGNVRPLQQYLKRERLRKLGNEEDDFSVYDRMIKTQLGRVVE